MSTVVHVTHEAVQKVGGIGAVLDGLITAKAYNKEIGRTILLGPLFSTEGPASERLGPEGEVLYSSIDGISESPYAELFRKVAQEFNVGLVYGRRRFENREQGIVVHPEVVLLEVSRAVRNRIDRFKGQLYGRFGLESNRYESIWDYEQYLRIAEPGYEVLKGILSDQGDFPCFLISHEFMGMGTVLKAILEGDARFKTVFYAHEVATMRPLVEDSLGHDTMFYNVLETATAEGQYIEDTFGPQDGFFKHALVGRARYCDNLFAVGDYVVKELRFMGPEYKDTNIDLVYNGIPAFEISLEEKQTSKERLQRYAENLLGYRPDFVFTHVTRLVISKGLWRDFKVLKHLDEQFSSERRTGVLFILSTQGGPKSPQDVLQIEKEYGWPVEHRDGYPDLVHDERFFNLALQDYNRASKAIKAVFVNQFGWDRERLGMRAPEDMEFMDIRKGSDVEFGQSIYEPFGIAQLEPLSFGALCVISNVCGCYGFVHEVTEGEGMGSVIVADYTQLDSVRRSLSGLLTIGMEDRDQIEAQNSKEVAEQIHKMLPRSDEEVERMIEAGYRMASKMSWEVVAEDYFLPGLKRSLQK